MKAIKALLAVMFLAGFLGAGIAKAIADEPLFEDERDPYAATLEDN